MQIKNNMVLFWGRKDPFSNWHPSTFTFVGRKFNCSEQYMMYAKAFLFGDMEALERIMATRDPREQKAIGRQVKGYDDRVWKAQARDLMLPGLVGKFEQNPEIDDVLVGSAPMLIVEAAPDDRLWGVGLAAEDSRILDKSQWLGSNWLGEVLMQARDIRVRDRQARPSPSSAAPAQQSLV